MKPADAGARQPLIETSANSASSSPRVKVSSPWEVAPTFTLGDDDAEFALVSTRGCLAPASADFISLSPDAKRLRSSPSFH